MTSDAKVFVIRTATEDDAADIAAMIEDIEKYYGSTTIDDLDTRLRQTRAALFGAEKFAYALVHRDDAGELRGFASYSFLWPAISATHTLFIKELYVSKDYRRQGLGVAFLKAIQDIAVSRADCSRVEWTADRDNRLALDFYKKQGLQIHEGKVYYRWEKP